MTSRLVPLAASLAAHAAVLATVAALMQPVSDATPLFVDLTAAEELPRESGPRPRPPGPAPPATHPSPAARTALATPGKGTPAAGTALATPGRDAPAAGREPAGTPASPAHRSLPPASGVVLPGPAGAPPVSVPPPVVTPPPARPAPAAIPSPAAPAPAAPPVPAPSPSAPTLAVVPGKESAVAGAASSALSTRMQVADGARAPDPGSAGGGAVAASRGAGAREATATPRSGSPDADGMAGTGVSGGAGRAGDQGGAPRGTSAGPQATRGGDDRLPRSAAGTPGAPGSEYTPYLMLVRRHIQEALRYPLSARRRGLTGTVHVEILIEPGGRITAASLVQSSSHALLDEAALEAVRSVPAVPFPSGLAPRPLRARLPVVFDLR